MATKNRVTTADQAYRFRHSGPATHIRLKDPPSQVSYNEKKVMTARGYTT